MTSQEQKMNSGLPDWSALILAGGQSSRMGRDKAWVESGGVPLIKLAVEKVRELGAREVLISGHPGEDYSGCRCPVLLDIEPGLGPMGGIERGLQATNSPLLLVLAVDLPQMSSGFLRKLLSHCDRLTGVVPVIHGEIEPLAAVYPRRCHAFALSALANLRRSVRNFAAACLREHAVRKFPVSAADVPCFSNWNSPADVKSC